MECYFGDEFREAYVCELCGRVQRSKGFSPWQVHATCKVDRDLPLVGNELSNLFRTLGIVGMSSCTCAHLAGKMNARGPEWCRTNRDKLLEELRKNYALYDWSDKLKAALAAVTSGLAWEMEDWSDPLASLFELAIRRAELNTPSPPRQSHR